MSTWPDPPSPLPASLLNLAEGFHTLPTALSSTLLIEKIDTIRFITLGFYMYQSRHPSAPSLVRIIWARNCVHHDLLSLPTTLIHSDASKQPQTRTSPTPSHSHLIHPALQALYEVLRLSALAYMLLMLFPVPRMAGIHAKLSQSLMLALDNCTVLDLWDQHPQLLLWSTVLGGIIADEGTLRSWFADMASQARPRLTQDTNVTSWKAVRDICASFLWFPGPECDGEGRKFWEEVERPVLPKTARR